MSISCNVVATLYFTHKVQFKLNDLHAAILLGMGLQHKEVDTLHVRANHDGMNGFTVLLSTLQIKSKKENSEIPTSQLLGHFKQIMHRFTKVFKSIEESEAASSLPEATSADMTPITLSLDSELVGGELGTQFVIIVLNSFPSQQMP